MSGRSARRRRASVGGTSARRTSALQAWRKYEVCDWRSSSLPVLEGEWRRQQELWSRKMRVVSALHVRAPLVDCRESACRLPGARPQQRLCAVGVGSVGGGRRRRVARLGLRVDAAAGDRWEEAPLPPPHVDYISSVTNPYVKHCVKLKKRCVPTRCTPCHPEWQELSFATYTFRNDECTPAADACRHPVACRRRRHPNPSKP